MTDNEVTLGEVYRAVIRLQISQDRTTELVAGLPTRLDAAERRLDKVEPRLDSVAVNAGFIAGGVAVAGFLLSLLWKW